MITPSKDQQIAIEKIRDNLSYALDAEIGAGKTLPAAYAVKSLIEEGRVNTVYILCTPSGRIQWWNKLREYYPESLSSLVVRKGDVNWLRKNYISIIAYSEIIKIDKETLPRMDREHTMVIVDESHKIKSFKAKCTEATFILFKKARRKLLMSGTMIGTGYVDLYAQYKFLGIPGFVPTKDLFYKRYTEYEWKKFGKEPFRKILAYKNIDHLLNSIRQYSYSFSIDKPHHTSTNHLMKVPSESMAKYEKVIASTIIQPTIMNWTKYRPLEEIISIFYRKAQMALKIYEEFPQPTIVFYNYRVEKNMLDQQFCNIPHNCIEGGMTPSAKLFNLDNFRDGKSRVLIAQIKTITDSVDIQTATRIIFTGPTYSLIDYKQAVGRISRRGQKYPTSDVMIVVRDSIDEHIAEILHERKTNYTGFKATIRDLARTRFVPVHQKKTNKTQFFTLQN